MDGEDSTGDSHEQKLCGPGGLLGKSEAMQKVRCLIAQAAASRTTVLIQGERGTGKETAAKLIHVTSTRAEQAFVPANIGSIPADSLESELFGHVRGAFPGAAAKRGLFDVADHGTIFLDEIAAVGRVETQSKLARVIEQREFTPLGGTQVIRPDVRIIAATSFDLRKLVQDGRFREDLFYRLNVVLLRIPPLRERREDIPLLLDHFLAKHVRENGRGEMCFTPEALKLLTDYDWPGNVTELVNAVEHAVVVSPNVLTKPGGLPDQIAAAYAPERSPLPRNSATGESLFQMTGAFERRVILEALSRARGSQTEAAEQLRIPLSTLNQKIKRLRIDTKHRA